MPPPLAGIVKVAPYSPTPKVFTCPLLAICLLSSSATPLSTASPILARSLRRWHTPWRVLPITLPMSLSLAFAPSNLTNTHRASVASRLRLLRSSASLTQQASHTSARLARIISPLFLNILPAAVVINLQPTGKSSHITSYIL